MKTYIFFFLKLNKILKKIFLFSLLICSLSISSQELNCKVSVLSPKVQKTNKEIFNNLEKAIQEFINSRRWTSHLFNQEEKIDCTMIFTIDSWEKNIFSGNLQIQAYRPVFNANYKTMLLNYKDDDITFRYTEYESLEWNDNAIPDNLTAILVYYTYLILGLDYDSFSLNGGEEFFENAEFIVNQMQSSQENGWLSYQNTRNRYWIIENLQNSSYKAFHECMYLYHRLGLDNMVKDISLGKEKLKNGLLQLEKIHDIKKGTPLLQLFFSAKSEEIVKVFSESPENEKNTMRLFLNEIDPGNISKYKELKENNR